jgi:hypothetical protein
VCTEAVAVVRAVRADFFLDGWHVEIVSDNSIQHIPWGVHVSTELFPSNSYCTVACLHSCYLAVGLQVTILIFITDYLEN